MKKFILVACCLFLSGAAAQALSFRNDTREDWKFLVKFGEELHGFDIKASQRIRTIDVPIIGAWAFPTKGRAGTSNCVPKGVTVSLMSTGTFVIKPNLPMDKTCVLEN